MVRYVSAVQEKASWNAVRDFDCVLTMLISLLCLCCSIRAAESMVLVWSKDAMRDMGLAYADKIV